MSQMLVLVLESDDKDKTKTSLVLFQCIRILKSLKKIKTRIAFISSDQLMLCVLNVLHINESLQKRFKIGSIHRVMSVKDYKNIEPSFKG